MIGALFAREAQCAAFMRLCLLGAAAGAWLHLSGAMYQKCTLLGALWDVLGASALSFACLVVMLFTGDGLRAYGVLALALGAGLYALGVAPLVRAARKICMKFFSPKAGKAAADTETTQTHPE